MKKEKNLNLTADETSKRVFILNRLNELQTKKVDKSTIADYLLSKGFKKCSSKNCKENILPIRLFTKDITTPSGYHSHCKLCRNSYNQTKKIIDNYDKIKPEPEPSGYKKALSAIKLEPDDLFSDLRTSPVVIETANRLKRYDEKLKEINEIKLVLKSVFPLFDEIVNIVNDLRNTVK